MLIRVSIDGTTRHYCADCAQEAEALGQNVREGHWVGKGWCYGCGLVGGGQGRRVKVKQAAAGPVLPKLTGKEQAGMDRLRHQLTGTEEE